MKRERTLRAQDIYEAALFVGISGDAAERFLGALKACGYELQSLESVRSEALEGERVMTLLRGAETTAAQSIEDHLAFWALIDEVEATRRGVVISHATDPLPTLKRKYGPLVDREFLLKTRALLTLSSARVAEGIANVALPIFSNERRVRNGFRNPERRKDKS